MGDDDKTSRDETAQTARRRRRGGRREDDEGDVRDTREEDEREALGLAAAIKGRQTTTRDERDRHWDDDDEEAKRGWTDDNNQHHNHWKQAREKVPAGCEATSLYRLVAPPPLFFLQRRMSRQRLRFAGARARAFLTTNNGLLPSSSLFIPLSGTLQPLTLYPLPLAHSLLFTPSFFLFFPDNTREGQGKQKR